MFKKCDIFYAKKSQKIKKPNLNKDKDENFSFLIILLDCLILYNLTKSFSISILNKIIDSICILLTKQNDC